MTTLRSLRAMPLASYCLDRSSPFFNDPFAPHSDGSDPWPLRLPDGWRRRTIREWTHCSPEADLADQGWKIHVCATPATAAEVLHTVAEHCFGTGVHFKYLSSPWALEMMNSKYSSRATSGKFITLYPADDIELMDTLHELDSRVGGLPGPYILSDLRWNRGPLHVRYGAFKDLAFEDHLGHRAHGLRQPDGTMTSDLRVPYFHLPEWAPVPEGLRTAMTPQDSNDASPYDFTEALHFSNGGGVYKAVQCATGIHCVVKEARPHAGLDGFNNDAAARLSREATALVALEQLVGVPGILERFTLWEHEYLALEQMEGVSLRQWVAETSPDIRPDRTQGRRTEYGRQCEVILSRLGDLVRSIHERGWIHGDVHPSNILVTEDLSVSLIDFEQSCPIDAPVHPGLGARGFVRRGHGGRPLSVSDDLFGVAAIGLWMFSPLLMMLPDRPDLTESTIEQVRSDYGLSPEWTEHVEEPLVTEFRADVTIAGDEADGDTRSRDLTRLLSVSVDALQARLDNASGTPSEAFSEPLFPGDVHQLLVDTVNLSSGAAGPLFALQSVGAPVPGWALDGLHERAREMAHPGLLCGMAGPALVLQRAGRVDQAEEILRTACELAAVRPDVTASTGRSGVILTLLAEEFELREELVESAVRLAGGMAPGAVYRAGTPTGDAAGLAEGHSGPAVACARLASVLGEPEWAARGTVFLERDLACTRVHAGMRLVDENEILYPYLAHGAAGLLVAWGELRACGADVMDQVGDELVASLDVASTVEPGLFDGCLGMAAALQHLRSLGLDAPDDVLMRHLHAASNFTVPAPDGGHALAGRGLRALSLDLSTGAAGLITTITAVTSGVSPLPALGSRYLHVPAPDLGFEGPQATTSTRERRHG